MTEQAAVSVTEAAAKKIKEIKAAEDRKNFRLRLEVLPGGCAGMRYGLTFDDEQNPGDTVFESSGVEVIVDSLSLPHFQGVIVDWVEGLKKSGFVINNPNSHGTCACGDSFQ